MIHFLVIFAVWRVTSLFYAEAGPYDIFAKIRLEANRKKVTRVFECFWCLSVWVALLIAPFFASNLKEFFIYWLAYSAGAIIIQQIIERLDDVH